MDTDKQELVEINLTILKMSNIDYADFNVLMHRDEKKLKEIS